VRHNPRRAGAKWDGATYNRRKERKTMSDRQKEARAATRRQLMRWHNTTTTIKKLRGERDKLAEDLASCYDLSPKPLNGMPSTGGPGDPTGRAVLANDRRARRLERELDDIAERLAELQHYVALIEDAVNGLPALECRVIRLRYMTYGSSLKGFWADLAATIPVSVDYAKELEAKAVDRLAGILEGM